MCIFKTFASAFYHLIRITKIKLSHRFYQTEMYKLILKCKVLNAPKCENNAL